MDRSYAIDIADLWFAYNGHPILREVNLRIPVGERVCIVGPNGGGKTTLLKLMLGLLRPNRGAIRIFGHAPDHARRRIGYAPQHAQFDPTFPVSVMDVAMMGRIGKAGLFGPYRRADRVAATEALEKVGLYDLRRRRMTELSGGQRQRLLIARAMASEPDLLLLDEPTANLDIGVEQDFYDLLRTLSKRLTIVMVSHDIGFVSDLVDKVICVRETVAVHPTAELTGHLMSELYGHDVRLIRHDHDCLRPADRGGCDA